MTITVIEQTTEERNQETQELFNEIRPYLDNGYSYMDALVKIGRVKHELRNQYYHQAWFRDLKDYGATQGYNYMDYSHNKGRR